MSKDLDYVGNLTDAFSRTAKSENFVPLIITALCSMVGSVLLVLGAPFALSLARMAIKVQRGESISTDMIWPGTEDAIRAIIAGLLGGMVVFVGMLLLVIPGIIAAILFSMTPFVLATTDLSPVDALKESMEIVKGNIAPVLIASVIAGALVGLLGSVVPAIGALVATPFAAVYLAKAYIELHAPPSGGAGPQIDGGETKSAF